MRDWTEAVMSFSDSECTHINIINTVFKILSCLISMVIHSNSDIIAIVFANLISKSRLPKLFIKKSHKNVSPENQTIHVLNYRHIKVFRDFACHHGIIIDCLFCGQSHPQKYFIEKPITYTYLAL
jgi:hypothetical protein